MTELPEEFIATNCPQCEGAGEIPKIGLDEDGYAIHDLWKECAHCEEGLICSMCDERPKICLLNNQCYEVVNE